MRRHAGADALPRWRAGARKAWRNVRGAHMEDGDVAALDWMVGRTQSRDRAHAGIRRGNVSHPQNRQEEMAGIDTSVSARKFWIDEVASI